jgi:hypothetical protein
VVFFAALLAAPAARPDVQIAGLTDLNLGVWVGAGDMTGDIGHCVHNSDSPGKYSIEASGDGAGGAFALVNGASSIPMQVSYSDGGGFTTLTANTPLGGQKGLNSTKFSQCLAGKGQFFIRILILGTDLAPADGGTYVGTLNLTVVPQ